MSISHKFNKIISLILIITLLWSDFAFLGKSLFVFAEGENEDFKLDVFQKAVNQIYTTNKQSVDSDSDNADNSGNINSEIMVQTLIKIGLKDDNLQSQCQVKKTQINIQVPQYNGNNAFKVEVKSKQTEFTNADEYAVNFNTSNWTYDSFNNNLIITVENPEGKSISGEDEYYISYFYNNVEYIPNIDINQSTDVSVILSINNMDELLNKQISDNMNVQTSDEAFIETSTDMDGISKGIFYANLNDIKEKYKVDYNYKLTTNINYYEKIDNIIISDEYDFLSKDNNHDEENILLDNSNSEKIYKTTKINQSEMVKLLGTDGYIEVIDENGNIIEKLDKNYPIDEDGFYTIVYKNPISKVSLRTSKPITNGFLRCLF